MTTTPDPRQIIAAELHGGAWLRRVYSDASDVEACMDDILAALREAGMAIVPDGNAFIDGEIYEVELTSTRKPDQSHLAFEVYNDMHFGNMGERWVWCSTDEWTPELRDGALPGAVLHSVRPDGSDKGDD